MAMFKRKRRLSADGDGLVLFAEVHEALKAEKVLKKTGHWVNLVAPPPELRKGCDLAVEIHLTEQPGIKRAFAENDVACIEIVPLREGSSELLDIVQVTDFGGWLMVKAGNMKLTFEKESGVIVNTSGGGCPDIPVMHAELIGKKLTEAPRPKDIGFTLCSLMLHRALEGAIEMYRGGDNR